jgi:hypothetical protein
MPVDIPLFMGIIVGVGISLLAIIVVYFALVIGHKQLELGEKEETALYGKNSKPTRGTYWQDYPPFDRAFRNNDNK